MSKKSSIPLVNYGGQALIEGILMRGRSYLTAAFRLPNGSIKVVEEKLTGIYTKKIRDIPFLRGLIILWDSLVLGMKYITISSNMQLQEEEEKIEGPVFYFTLLVSLLFALTIFFFLPTLLMQFLYKSTNLTTFTINIIEGILRLVIMIVYLSLIGKMEDIKRVFSYHGAEHKTIAAYEHGDALEVASVQKYSTAHPRCGTSFLLTVMVVSILVFSLFSPTNIFLRLLSRIILIPVVAMISYEFIRFLGKYEKNPIVKIISKPNLWLQKLTTNQPSDDMVEVALQSFKRLLQLEKVE